MDEAKALLKSPNLFDADIFVPSNVSDNDLFALLHQSYAVLHQVPGLSQLMPTEFLPMLILKRVSRNFSLTSLQLKIIL